MLSAFRHRFIVCGLQMAMMTTVVMMVNRGADAQFRDVTEEYGLSAGGKAAFADYDADNWVDVYAGGKLYRNINGERFEVVENSQLPGGEGIWGDYDNDGRVDLFVFTGTGSLHRNLGDGTFDRITFPELPTQTSRGAVWGDLNNDGHLDLYVGGYEVWQQAVHPDAIYLNQGDGSFVEHWRSPDNGCYSTRGVTSADFDEDGDLDVFTSHYRLQPNFLLQNDGTGQLADVAAEFGAAGIPDAEIAYTGGIRYRICGHTIGSAFGDLNNDGHIDLFVGNFSHPPGDQDRPQVLENLGPNRAFHFADRSADAGLAWQESFASPALADFDNDGDLDLYFTTVYGTGSGGIKNFPVLYRNEGDFRFVDVTEAEGLAGLAPTYQAAWADIDNDGDLDLCSAARLFLNEDRGGNWIGFGLSNTRLGVSRFPIGATVRIHLEDRTLTRHVETGTGEGNQNDARLHFGLGDHDSPVTVEVTLPGNSVHQFEDLPLNQWHDLTVTVGD